MNDDNVTSEGVKGAVEDVKGKAKEAAGSPSRTAVLTPRAARRPPAVGTAALHPALLAVRRMMDT
jgi:hypothetical protein